MTVVTINVRLPSNQLKRLQFSTHNRGRF